MTAAILIAKLLEVEKAIGRVHLITLRSMVLEAQGCVLEMEQEMIETLRENGRLRERMEKCEKSAQSELRCFQSLSELAADLSRALGRKPASAEVVISAHVLPEVLA